MRACIDIGSNTILFLAFEGDREICFKSRVCALGKNLDKKMKFEKCSMDKAYKAFSYYYEICMDLGIKFSDVKIRATEASRVASNSGDFFNKLKKDFSANIQIISSTEEAYFSALGTSRHTQSLGNEIVLMDIGGASTELICIRNHPFELIESLSLPLGAVRVTDWISEGVWDQKKKKILEGFNLAPYQSNTLVGVSGTMTALYHIIKERQSFQVTPLEQTEFSLEFLRKKMSLHRDKSPLDWEREFPFLGKRSEAIWGGYEASCFIGESLGVKELRVSFWGLIYGLMYDESSW